MDNLNGIAAFVRAAETCSYVAAGRLLGVSASAVGKSVARLEEKLGVRLLNRSTRRISLSNEGALFYERCQRILADLGDAEAELSHLAEAPRGKLKVSLPVIGYRIILPLLANFTRQYPEIELDLDFNDRLVDVVAEGVDVAVRSGTLTDSRLMARELGPFAFAIVGSPAYLARHGVPATPRALERHACVRYKFPTTGKLQEWAVRHAEGDGGGELRLPTALTCNNIEALIGAAAQGVDWPICRTLSCATPSRAVNCKPCWTGTWTLPASSGCCGRRAATCRRKSACLSTSSAAICIFPRRFPPADTPEAAVAAALRIFLPQRDFS
jgi:DNA-binding transcriptional LysR family regulator